MMLGIHHDQVGKISYVQDCTLCILYKYNISNLLGWMSSVLYFITIIFLYFKIWQLKIVNINFDILLVYLQTRNIPIFHRHEEIKTIH